MAEHLVVAQAPPLIAASALFLLAFWLLWLDFESRLHRAFALFLVLKAFFLGLSAFQAAPLDLTSVLRMYFAVAIPFAAVYFALVFHSHYAPSARPLPPTRAYSLAALVVATVVFLALFIVRRDLYHDGALSGPFMLFIPAAYTAFAAIAVLFGRLASTQADGTRRRALLLAALALSLQSVHQVVVQLAPVPFAIETYLDRPLAALERGVWLVTAGLLAWLAAHLFISGRKGRGRHELRGALLVMLLAVGTGLIAALGRVLGSMGLFLDLHWGLYSVWVVAGAGIIAYAVVRHRFLGSPRHLRLTVRTSTVVGALIVVFFVAKELLEEVLEERYPILPGLGAAVIAVLLLHPILIVVGRFLRQVMPSATPVAELKPDERRAVYRSQVEVVWMDGVITRKERRLLDRMQERLEIPAAQAARIEREVIGTQPETDAADSASRMARSPSRPSS